MNNSDKAWRYLAWSEKIRLWNQRICYFVHLPYALYGITSNLWERDFITAGIILLIACTVVWVVNLPEKPVLPPDVSANEASQC